MELGLNFPGGDEPADGPVPHAFPTPDLGEKEDEWEGTVADSVSLLSSPECEMSSPGPKNNEPEADAPVPPQPEVEKSQELGVFWCPCCV